MRHLSRPLPLWLLLLLVWGPGTAMAEEPSSCEEDRLTGQERGHEVEHRVEARPEGDLVRFTVHRTFHNPRPRHTELEAFLALPREGTVHGLALESQGQWTEGLLLEAPQAERRYEALRRKGPAAPRVLALLSSEAGAAVRLRLWNLPPRASVTVRYELRARLAYTHGRKSFTYPLPACQHAPRPALTLTPSAPGADLRLETRNADSWRPELEASWEAGTSRGLDARAGLVPWGAGTLGFLQVRAERLSEVPARARVVFVVDASHSVGPQGLSRQWELAGEYLQWLPDATAEVVVFRRSAERLFGRLIPASEWKTALATLPPERLAPGNGSNLDEGLKLAQRVLAEGSGPARVLAFTDGLLRQAFEPVPPAPSTSAPDAAVHLRRLSPRTGYATPHERLSGPLVQEACGTQLPSYAHGLEPLVRPLRWEQVHLQDGQGTRLGELPALEEGEGFQRWLPSPQTPLRELVLHGRRWGCAASQPVARDDSLSADLVRNAWATPRFEPWSRNKEEFPPEEAVELLAEKGDWVSGARSLLVVPSGAGPSTARTHALPDGITGGVAGGVVGGTITCPMAGSLRRATPPAELQEALERLLQPVFSTCLGEGGPSSLQVRVEATGDEIVDVAVTGAASEPQASCVREATWALRLPALWDDGWPGTYTLTPRR
ncbi:vault protein inter-alpha-trypsin-like protein [Archangium gephyra]|uniref:Signal peptide protein n=1 Tax=Archangium gephyra TaxID=48 RepID=A0AAC8QCF7_9BACT|nr:VWA domain-containing protein [Archangium gephyra]AKJ04869.1 Putative signal peptide protein [Archangium gephyra]REG37089.1 vault protein inter-alpha-trypsin-like protein [Archangium gephyra]